MKDDESIYDLDKGVFSINSDNQDDELLNYQPTVEATEDYLFENDLRNTMPQLFRNNVANRYPQATQSAFVQREKRTTFQKELE